MSGPAGPGRARCAGLLRMPTQSKANSWLPSVLSRKFSAPTSAGKAADRLDIGHIQAIENAARRRLGAEVGAENFRFRILGIREFALLCVGDRKSVV